MATGGGKPGYTLKAVVTADPLNGKITVKPKEEDLELWDYFAKAGTNEFVVQFLPVDGEHPASGTDQPQNT